MAYANFKPTIWSAKIQHDLAKFAVYKKDCNFQFEGDAGEGKRVKILGVGRPTIAKYIPGTDLSAPEQVADTSIYLDIDQYDSFNYLVDDIDHAQTVPGLMEALAEETTRALAEAEEKFIATQLATGAGYTTTPTDANTPDEIQAAIDPLFVQLWENGVKQTDDVTLYLPPWVYNFFENKMIALKTQNDSLIANGVLGTYKNAKVKMSNIYYDNGSAYNACVLKTSKAYAYCNGIDKLEPYRPEKRFADAIKGLNCYGGKMVRPKECAVALVKNA